MATPGKTIETNALGVLSRSDLCRLFTCCTATLRRWERLGLPVFKIGGRNYYRLVEVENWLQGYRTILDVNVRDSYVCRGDADGDADGDAGGEGGSRNMAGE